MQLAITRYPKRAPFADAAKVAITLRRDEHFVLHIHLPNTGRQIRNDEVQPMGRGRLDRVALLKALLSGARRLHFWTTPETAVPFDSAAHGTGW